jgi:hypothetical protein
VLQVDVDDERRRSVTHATPVGEGQGKPEVPGPHVVRTESPGPHVMRPESPGPHVAGNPGAPLGPDAVP